MSSRKKTILILMMWLSAGAARPARPETTQNTEAPPPFGIFKVRPNPRGRFISVEADLKLGNGPCYLKDFGQLEKIQWLSGGKGIPVKAKRVKDTIIFGPLPASGDVRAIYKLNCVTRPIPGYRKRLLGTRGFILAREGLFMGVERRENGLVDIRWSLPDGWRLAMGKEGIQRFVDTQRTLWIAGKTKHLFEQIIDGQTLKIAVLDGTSDLAAQQSVEAAKAIFQYGWTSIGPLEGQAFGLAFFPRGTIGGGTALFHSMASEEDLLTAVHEMLHWWTNITAPAWFREGVHTYLAWKLLVKLGILNASQLQAALESFIDENEKVVRREGKRFSLAESSENYDRQRGGGDVYGLMPLLAYKLDREIQALNPKAGLELVFAAAGRQRLKKFDFIALIKDVTGYDPEPLFQKYFYAIIDNPSDLLK
jgi:hypothetical protein